MLRKWIWLTVSYIFHLSLSTVYLHLFHQTYKLTSEIAQIHVIIISAIWMLLYSIVALIVLIFRNNYLKMIGRTIIAALFTTYILLINVFYNANYISTASWTEYVNAKLAMEYLNQFQWLLSTLPFEKSFIYLILTLVAVLIAVIFFVYFKFSLVVYGAFEQLHLKSRTGNDDRFRLSLLLVTGFGVNMILLSRFLPGLPIQNSLLYVTLLNIAFVVLMIISLHSKRVTASFKKFSNKFRTKFNIIVPWYFVIAVLVLGVDSQVYMALKVHSNKKINKIRLNQEPVWSFVLSTSQRASLTPHRLHAAAVDNNYRKSYERKKLSEDTPNVILVIVDALRADHMQVYGYHRATTPFLNRLYQQKKLTRVDYAFATCASSYGGILSILSSKPVRYIAQTNFRINDLLQDHGFNTNFIVAGSHENYYNLKSAYGESVDFYYEGKRSEEIDSNDDRILFEGLSKLKDFSGQPAFFYFHMMSIHLLGAKNPDYKIYQPAVIDMDLKGFFSIKKKIEKDPAAYINRYDNSILQMDAYLEKLFEMLDEKGYLNNSFVIITSDHGESLGERSIVGHGHHLYREEIQIPLLIYDPRGNREIIPSYATQIDIAPTIADRIGLPVPGVWYGHSLLRALPERYTFHEIEKYPWQGVMYWNDNQIYKYLKKYHTPRSRDSLEALYEIVSDPYEQNNLITSADKAFVSKLRNMRFQHWQLSKDLN